MVLAGIESVIPPDDVIDAMGEIGHEMSYKIKETACQRTYGAGGFDQHEIRYLWEWSGTAVK